MKNKLMIGLLLLSLLGACAQETVTPSSDSENETVETTEESDSTNVSESTNIKETSEDTKTNTSKQKKHGAVESESTLITVYELNVGDNI